MAVVGKFTTGYLLVNSVVLTERVQSATLTVGKEELDLTVFTNEAKVRGVGLQDHSLNVTFIEDLAASGAGAVQATLLAIWAGGVPVPIWFALAGATPATTNVVFKCNYILTSIPIGGQHGQTLKTQVTFKSCAVMDFDTTP